MRALFWGALATLACAGGLLSTGMALPFAGAFDSAAPLLSMSALVIAVAGWRILHRELAERANGEREARGHVRQLHEAMYASADGLFLLRGIRDAAGEVVDLEISDVNPSGARLVRRERQQLMGQRLRRDLSAIVDADLLDRYIAVIGSRETTTAEVRVNRRRFAASWLYHQAVATGDGIAVTVRDISAGKREEVRLRRATLTDDLTRLYNRRGFLTLADQQLRIARRQAKDAVLLYVDMDDFKALNDRHGHAEGDRALAAVGRLLRRAVRDCDVVARMGGDEFTIMALDADRAAARLIQRRIEERITLLNASGELAAPLSLTIGHTRVRPTDDASLPELLARADTLLLARKKRRRLTALLEQRVASRGRTRTVTRMPMAPAGAFTPRSVASARLVSSPVG